MSQFTAWRNGGGVADMTAVSTALSRSARAGSAVVADAFSSASLSRLATAAAGVQQAAQTAQSNAPPACVPNLATDEGAAMADWTQAAQGELDEVQAFQNGDTSTALADIRAAGHSAAAGLRALRAALTDINGFMAS